MRYVLKIRKRNDLSQFGQALTRSSWKPLLLIKLQASSLGSTTPESRRQQLPVMRTPGKQLGTPKTSSSSSSKNNGPHPRRTLSPALVTPEADWSTHSTSLRFSRPGPAILWHLAGQCVADAWGSGCQIWMDFHCPPWPLSLMGIISVLFITGPTRLPGWGGFTEQERDRPTDRQKRRTLPLLEWRM